MPKGSLFNACLFLHKAHHSLPVPGNTRQQCSTMLGGHIKEQNHQRKSQMWKMWYLLNVPQKKTLVYSMRDETRKQNVIFFKPTWEHV